MLEHTKALHTDAVTLSFTVPSALVAEVRDFMRQHGIAEERDFIPWREAMGIIDEELPATCLRGARYREGLTQQQLSDMTGIPKRHISEMENGKRPIGKHNARRLADALHIDPRRLLSV
ncbi:MAG: helix-turn-helix transcriptional regulator [Desulfovibrio sp.]|nr:helix-turn-helix transcriptional regulator [Desulfovibrio sp.]